MVVAVLALILLVKLQSVLVANLHSISVLVVGKVIVLKVTFCWVWC